TALTGRTTRAHHRMSLAPRRVQALKACSITAFARLVQVANWLATSAAQAELGLASPPAVGSRLSRTYRAASLVHRTRYAMAEPADVQAHWTRPGVLARIDAALTELGHDPQNLNPEILATLEHLHSGGLATTRRQANRIAVTEDSRVLDVGCGIGGPARYLAHTYGCRVDGIDLTPELIETGRVLTERCKLADRVVLQVGNALDLPYPDQTFDVVWCQNVAMNISDKAGLLAGAYRVLKPGGLFTSTEYSVGAGG